MNSPSSAITVGCAIIVAGILMFLMDKARLGVGATAIGVAVVGYQVLKGHRR